MSSVLRCSFGTLGFQLIRRWESALVSRGTELVVGLAARPLLPSEDKLRSTQAAGHYSTVQGASCGETRLFTRPTSSTTWGCHVESLGRLETSRGDLGARRAERRASTPGREGGFTKLAIRFSCLGFGFDQIEIMRLEMSCCVLLFWSSFQ